ncbi:YmdB family metallophosphoesterase [Ruminococcaceae bacterium OttesenSCG-928-I18]|nr:YmdB family metallophosphoesterase [Ruminococcaceae bacterium OttesenSCG-928-I18]
MRFLCVGDVVGDAGLSFFCERLPYIKKQLDADFVIVNGENSDRSGVGVSRSSAEALLQYADVVTTGNHCYRRAGEELFSENERLLHPANYPYTEDTNGRCFVDTGRHGTVCVLNLSGLAFLEPLDSPFQRVDALLQGIDARYILLDFHAESTAEKKAFAYYLDGRAGAVFGTHTHVQTADEQILPGGTGYITDLGMTGPVDSVIGVRPQQAIKKQKDHVPVQFSVAEGPCMLGAALFTLSDETGLCERVQRIQDLGNP